MISTHILDTSLGNPAQGVRVELSRQIGTEWTLVDAQLTNADGRISFTCPSVPATYRLNFEIGPYFIRSQLTPFFSQAPVIFQITDTQRKYHVPLLLNPYGYSTYRGS